MNRLFPIALFAAFIGGCARSDLGERAASEVVKTAVEGEAAKAKEDATKIGSAEGKDSKLTGTDANGSPLWELSAKLIKAGEPGKNGTPRRATLTNAIVKLYREGKLESTFDAPLIEFFNPDSGLLRLAMTQGVRASNQGALGKSGVPIAISAPRGDVDITKRLVSLTGDAKQTVRVTRGPIVVTGKNLRTQTDLARANMSGDVTATAPQGVTRARDAVFAWRENRLTANAVTFTRPDLTLTGDKLSADTASEKGVLTGNVKAVAPDSSASAPSVDFDWKADSIRAPRANVSSDGAQMQTASLQTDSKLAVANAQSVTIRKDGATLKAASAQGFDGLKRLSGTRVTVVRDGTTLTAARADARDWSAKSGTIIGSGGVTARSAQGRVAAPNATWSGGENGVIKAEGGVEIVADGTTIRGQSGTSDANFGNATLSGDVRAELQNGSTLAAPQVVKRGAQIVASGGTTAQFKTTTELGLLTMKAPRVETTMAAQTARASGGVNLKSASGATATAPTATFNRASQKVVASGGVTYQDPARGVSTTGRTLTADLRLQSAVITDAKGQGSSEVFGDVKLFD